MQHGISPSVKAATARQSSQRSLRSQGPLYPRSSSQRPILSPSRRAVSALNQLSSGYLATPDTIDGGAKQDRPARLRGPRDHSQELLDTEVSQTTGYSVGSPAGSDSHTVFSGSVATPPVTDGDAEPFLDLDNGALFRPRPTVDTVTAQDASLPSPRLSPTLAGAQLHDGQAGHGDVEEQAEEDDETIPSQSVPWNQDIQATEEGDSAIMSFMADDSQQLERYRATTPATPASGSLQPSLLHTRAMLENFDAMPTELKTFMMYQLLRRCPRKTLHMISDVVTPALKCDYLRQLPLELGWHVLSYLDAVDLCRAARVSKHWRNLIDSNENGWKELLERDGLHLGAGELERAINQGWGWQDPVGVTGCELDLSLQNRLTSTETELVRSSSRAMDLSPPLPKLRSSKRKRVLNTYSNSERVKRRASDKMAATSAEERMHERLRRGDGPRAAAEAAALAVPDPGLGLPSLRKLHLYKSLYRRHHMIQQNWTSGKVKPSHVAFAAHPRHVITCLQFDADKIITGSDDTLIHVYDTKTGQLRKKLEGHEGGVWALQYEGNTLVSGSTDRSVRVWDIEKGLCTQVFYGHTSTVRCLQILKPTDTGKNGPDGKAIMMPPKPLIITGSRDSQLRVWRLPEAGSRRYIQTGPPQNEAECPYFIRILQGHVHSVRAIAAHCDTLVSGSYDATVRVWRISTGEALHVLHGHSQKVYSVVLDHKRNRCISGSMDSLVKIWDLATGACLHTLEGHSLLVGLLDLRDERLVSAAADSTLRIWDPDTGKCKSTLIAHTGAITCFQHDGRKVISGSEKTVKMWDVATGECIQDLLNDLSGVWQVKFDERRCVAAVQRGNLTFVEVSFSSLNVLMIAC
jgi:F-box and WD-40 domain protein CDC4